MDLFKRIYAICFVRNAGINGNGSFSLSDSRLDVIRELTESLPLEPSPHAQPPAFDSSVVNEE